MWYSDILANLKGEYKIDYKLAHLTWFKVGGKADLLLKPANVDDLALVLSYKPADIDVFVLGAGSNTIIRDGGIAGLVIKLGQAFSDIKKLENGNLLVGCGCLNFHLAKFASINSITGFEFMIGVPGTIGGGVAMNAGSYGQEFKDIVEKVYAIDMSGKKHILSNADMGFTYRGNSIGENWIFTAVEFRAQTAIQKDIENRMVEINEKRRASQPVSEMTGGSTFANPAESELRAWQLIDQAGMRGAKIGGAMMSDKHCNFMINTGSASAKDLEELGDLVKENILQKFGINLKWEIKRVGRFI